MTLRWILIVVAVVQTTQASAGEVTPAALHEQIDRAIASAEGFPRVPAAASDAEFLRRIYLDLTGVIPSADEVRAYLRDANPNKRTRLIDRLLGSAGFARHMQTTFDVLLMERRPYKYGKQHDWQEYLRLSFAANKPYDQLVREILSVDGSDPKTRAAARFYLDRNGEPHLLTRDISRLFLGMNLQCAQCHDHPRVEAYKQEDYYGIYAFLSRSFVFTDKRIKAVVLAEKAEGDVSFQSVFLPKVTKKAGPRVPDRPALVEPKLEMGKEYTTAPATGVRPIPAHSRRSRLAKEITSSPRFARSAANRLWAMMLGRGLVHPVDYDHGANPPSHPELLNLLAVQFAARKYDIKFLLREIALSQTYQRSGQLPAGREQVSESRFAVALLRPLSPEQFAWSLMQATGLIESERRAQEQHTSEQELFARLSAHEASFATLFGSMPGEPADLGYQATLDQALFLNNGALVRGWLTPHAGNLMDRLTKLPDARAIAEELYLSAFTRMPTGEEQAEIERFLSRHAADRQAALQELAWALLASAEFRFNH
jgi:hypothetical protein